MTRTRSRGDGMRLGEGGDEVGAITHAAAAAGGRASIGAVVGARLRAGLAVLEDVAVLAAGLAGGADEDAGVHIGGALRALDGDVVAIHVDFTGDIDNAVRAGGPLNPGLGDLTVDEFGVVVDGGHGAGEGVAEAQGVAGASSDGDGDEGLLSVDPGRGRSPDNNDDVLTRVVAELVGVGPILTDPHGLGTVVGIDTASSGTKFEQLALIGASQLHVVLAPGLNGGGLADGKLISLLVKVSVPVVVPARDSSNLSDGKSGQRDSFERVTHFILVMSMSKWGKSLGSEGKNVSQLFVQRT